MLFSSRLRADSRRVFTIAAVLLAGSSIPAPAHDLITTKITWSREISRLIYRNCASCHREGGAAFSLVTFQDARPWAKAIKDEVLNRRMPPWNAVKGFGDLKDDRGLPQQDLELIAQWVEGGAPEGNPRDAPPAFTAPATADPQEKSPPSAGISISGETVLKSAVEGIGIEPAELGAAGNLQVTALRPDGRAEPLLWIRNFDPKYRRVYYFRQPMKFPAGTKIQVFPAAARAVLFTGAAARRKS